MSPLLRIVRRDLALAFGQGGAWLPLVFFLLVATLYPFAVGPDAAVMARTGGGVLWMAALLAALLPVDRLVIPDAEAGVLDQYAVRGLADEAVAAAKIVAHWLSFGPPLMLAVIPAADRTDARRHPRSGLTDTHWHAVCRVESDDGSVGQIGPRVGPQQARLRSAEGLDRTVGIGH